MKIFYQCTDFFFRSCILPILRRFAFCLHFDWGPEGQKLDERTSAGRSRSPPRDWQRNAAEINYFCLPYLCTPFWVWHSLGSECRRRSYVWVDVGSESELIK